MKTKPFASSVRIPIFASRGFAVMLLPMLAIAMAMAGCSVFPKPQADPTRYYVLTSALQAASATPTAGRLRVGLNAVRTAGYLDGKAMIVRRGENEIDYRDFARWAEPLSAGVGRILSSHLLASGKVARVYQQPFPLDSARDLDVSVSILRCEGLVKNDGTASASFVCAFEITQSGPDGVVLGRRVFTAPGVAWKEGDYASLASALSEAVAQLSDAILADLPSP